ncbi:MAG: NAD(P)/FAD-dependent oxidoreductase, partial [Verrucomicrobiales bacterium]
MSDRFEIAIVGCGPAGGCLAALLSQRGFKVLVFDDEKRPDLLVGESLLPPVVNLMRKLEIEERVKAFSQHKSGVGFIHRGGLRLDFQFPEKALGTAPNYAYNVPRPQFDDLLRTRAEELGATFVKRRAEVETGPGPNEVRLSDACLAETPELANTHPKLLIDATGRARLFARTLEIPAHRGSRNDLAYFAHFEDFDSGGTLDGQVVLSILDHGWSWRIPLPGRLSVGIVIDKTFAAEHGSSAAERLDSIIDAEPILREAGKNRKRVSEVMTYSNYQLVSERGHGPGWASIGDAFGFVDPMLSPGLFMAMLTAERLDELAFAGGKSILDHPSRLSSRIAQAEDEMRQWHQAWGELIEYFYDGRIFSLYEGGSKLSESHRYWAPPSIMERHLSKQLTRLVSGVSTRKRYGRRLLALASKHLVWDTQPPEF